MYHTTAHIFFFGNQEQDRPKEDSILIVVVVVLLVVLNIPLMEDPFFIGVHRSTEMIRRFRLRNEKRLKQHIFLSSWLFFKASMRHRVTEFPSVTIMLKSVACAG